VAFFREEAQPPSGRPAAAPPMASALEPSSNGHGAVPRPPARARSSAAAPAGASDRDFAPF